MKTSLSLSEFPFAAAGTFRVDGFQQIGPVEVKDRTQLNGATSGNSHPDTRSRWYRQCLGDTSQNRRGWRRAGPFRSHNPGRSDRIRSIRSIFREVADGTVAPVVIRVPGRPSDRLWDMKKV